MNEFTNKVERTYKKGWKAFQFNFIEKPKGVNEWFNLLWGWDIWFHNFPLIKTLVASNILIWFIFAF